MFENNDLKEDVMMRKIVGLGTQIIRSIFVQVMEKNRTNKRFWKSLSST